ncbi:MAG: DUF1501 domain-containing protein [Myxococcota bacterium]
MNRRQFLTVLGAAGAVGTTSFLPTIANANGVAKQLIIVFASGGWDTTYLFDAKPASPLVDTPHGDWRAFGNGAVWLSDRRPGVTQFFDAYGSVTSVVNSINVPSVAHASCTHRMLTGSRDASRPDVAAIIGHEFGQDTPMPYLDIGGNARPGVLGADMGYMGANNQLRGLLVERQAPTPPDRADWHRYFATDEEFDRVEAYVQARSARGSERGALGENARRFESFQSGLRRSHQLREYESFFANIGRGRAFEDQARVGVEALQAGVSRTLFLSLNADFDTHTNNAEQNELYDSTFTSLTALLDELASTPGRTAPNMLDETIVLLASEMGRTPTLNSQEGKDHWPITSCLVMGAGIRGNRVLGGTDEGLGALYTDLNTGEVVDTGGVIIQPEHIHSALLELIGIDPEPWFPGAPALRGLHA